MRRGERLALLDRAIAAHWAGTPLEEKHRGVSRYERGFQQRIMRRWLIVKVWMAMGL